MNVYDFDNTIYDGESVFDFYLFSVRRQPSLIRYLFVVLGTLIRYKLCCINAEEFEQIAKKHAKSYLLRVRDMDGLIREFWDQNEHKIKPFYKTVMRDDDVIISASVDVLLKELFSRIGVKHYITSKVDKTSGEVLEICYRKNKVSLFQREFPDAQIDNFYTDSKNDAAMMQLAKKTYLVKGEEITLLDAEVCDKLMQKYIE